MPSLKPIRVIGNGAFGKLETTLIPWFFRLCFRGGGPSQESESCAQKDPEGGRRRLERVSDLEDAGGSRECRVACRLLLLGRQEAESDPEHSDGVLQWKPGGYSKAC